MKREARVSRVKENSELAFYAAEAGFNRVRAWMITQAPLDTIETLSGRSDTLEIAAGEPGGSYVLTVIRNPDDSVTVISVGTYGSGSAEAQRVVRGILRATGDKWNGDKYVETTYVR